MSDNQCGVFTVPALGGAEREIASIGPRSIEALVWSPDEQTLAYSARSEPGEALSIYLLSVETMQERKLTSPSASDFGDLDPAFSPDGERLAFTRSVIEGVQDIYVVSVQGGTPRQLTSDNAEITGLDWSNNGEIVFASNQGGASSLWRVSLAGGTPSWIATAGDGVSIHHPSISRTGEHLSYEQRTMETNIWQLRRGRSQPQRLISSTRWDSNPAFSPDGERIVFASRRSGSQEIWVSKRDGSDPVQLTFFEGSFASTPRWSPDGTQIAFDSKGGEDEGAADVYVMSTAGDQPRPLTTSEADDFAPSWSRDGQWVYFVSNRSGTWQIWRMPAVGGTAEQVTRKGGVMAFESFDGEWLYYAKGDTAGIWRTPTSGFPNTAVPDYAALHADSLARAGASVGSLNAITGPGSLAASAKPGSLAVVDTAAFAATEAAA
ncbi:MAG: DPP IV N-terminal domain-containing protein, partial [Rhodothermales bacterium]